MKYVEGKIGKIILGKLEKGDDLLLSIKKIAEENSIKAGSWYAIGTLFKVHFYFYRPKPRPTELIEPLEIVACSGSIFRKDDETFVHGHIDVTDNNFISHGGHLLEGSYVDAMAFVTILEVLNVNAEDIGL
jgi:predicted DNA-binding protein with PD1-like motif